MYAVRVNSMNENVANENDQDANSILTELDKGLRSSKIGEQCEAIVRFPKLFEKYPFPILINSSFLKLGEFFRTGTNLLRLWVLRVCQQSEKHLDKILNVDEFIKRIFTVMHSNDPIARAITLRTIGAVAGVIPEKQQVHHAIRRALDSHDTVEVEAAIHASVQYAAQSKTFAISMCSKIAAMIESLQTPISMKIQLIPVLRHMHHDANTAALVKMLCINLLPKYPSQSFVIVILDSLTQLSCATLVDIPDQVNLLVTYLQDPRKRVRYQVLRSLQSLAEKGAHLWSKSALKSLISIAMTCSDLGNEQSLLLSVVLTLTNCPVTCYSFISEEENLVLELCSTCLLLEHHTAASQALAILTSLVLYCFTEKMTPPASYMEQINLHIESLIYSSLTNDKLLKQFSQYLKCGVRLSEKNIAFGENFVELIGGLLTDDFVYPTKQSILMCETLGAICSHFFNNNNNSTKINQTNELNVMKMDIDDNTDNSCTDLIVNNSKNKFHQLLPKLFKKLELIINENDLLKINKDNVHLIEVLSAVCLQSMLGYFINENLMEIFYKIFNVTNYWTQYRIARSASRYGHHYLAAQLYFKLSNNVSLEKLHFFLLSLFHVSKAECILIHGYEYDDIVKNYNLINPNIVENSGGNKKLIISERLDKAITLYWKALATLKASSSPTHPMTFQSEFIRLRGQYLESIFNIVIARNTQCITPPPAIAQTLAQNSRDHLQKYGHVTNQLRKTVKCIKICEDMYSKLYKSAFDADPCTLEYLTITQYLCAILGNSIETICFVSPSEIPSRPAECSYPETKYLYNCCNKIINELNNLPNESGNMKSITNKHTDVILSQIEIATKSPICIPRFFFQVLQNTSIKLSISPQPRLEPVLVQCNSNLVVKVEGVIQHYGKHVNIYRSIDTIQLTLVSQLLSQRPNDIKQPNDTITLTQTVVPHRDFLTGSFLLPLNNNVQIHMGMPIVMGGQWQVTVEACVIDQNGILWNTGPKSVLMVRVLDDPTKTAAVTAAVNRRF